MNEQEFREAVRHMRNLQKEYFRTRLPSVLNAAKAAESTVDRELAGTPAPDENQPELFHTSLIHKTRGEK